MKKDSLTSPLSSQALSEAKDIPDDVRAVSMKEIEKALETARRETNKAMDDVSVKLGKMFEREL